MRIIITGGSGLIGRALTESLVRDGHEVSILSRSPGRVSGLPDGAQAIGWDTRTADGWGQFADGAHGIVNLAGASLAGEGFFPARWTAERKQRIRQSRLEAGQAVVDAVQKAAKKPQVVIQSSAVGYYGPHQDEMITEENPPGDDFLANLCVEWENSTAVVKQMGVRQAIIRTGLVLSLQDGSLPRLVLPYKLFVGGPLGNGKQWMSWIHLRDEVRAIRFLLEQDGLEGPFNLTAPNPVRNNTLGQTIAHILKRPHLFPVPGFVMRTLFGEVSTVILEGQRVVPARLQDASFNFEYRELEPALRQLLQNET